MNRPLFTWDKLLKKLGFKVNWKSIFARKQVTLQASYEDGMEMQIESLEPRQMLSTVSAFEGQSVFFEKYFDIDTPDATYSIQLDKGDGSYPIAIDNVDIDYNSIDDTYFAFTEVEDIVYADDGQYLATLNLFKDGNLYASETETIEIENVAPIIQVSSPDSNVQTGEQHTIEFRSVDPGDDQVATWFVDWGDGSDIEEFDGSLDVAGHVYDTEGSFEIVVTAIDEDNESVSGSLIYDSTFGTKGLLQTDIDGSTDNSGSILALDDGKLLVGGTALIGEENLVGGSYFSFNGNASRSDNRRVIYFGDEYYEVDREASYRISAVASSGDGYGNNANVDSRSYLGYASYDVDKKLISPIHYSKYTGVDTRLAVELKDGDTEIVLEDGTGWYDGSASAHRSFAWYGYTDSTGHIYDDYTYTRNTKQNLWDQGAITGNVITLRAPWNGGTIPTGAAVRNAASGAIYNYALAANEVIPETPTTYTTVIGNGRGGATGIRVATKYLRPLVLANWNRSVGNQLNVGDFRIDPVREEQQNSFVLARYNADGTQDSTFGTAGIQTANLVSRSSSDQLRAIDLQSDGKIVAVGKTSYDSRTDTVIARYTVDGMLDSSFGVGGVVTFDVAETLGLSGESNEEATSVVATTNHLFVVGSFTHSSKAGKAWKSYVAKLNLDGTLDSSFGTNGLVSGAFQASKSLYGNTLAYGIAMQSDGKVLITGYTHNADQKNAQVLLVARYLQDGSLDTSFGDSSSGYTRFGDLSGNEAGFDILVKPDDSLLVIGYADQSIELNDFLVVAFTSDGQVDTSYGDSGVATVGFGGSDFGKRGVLLDDGSLVVAGHGRTSTDGQSISSLAVAKLTPTGQLDSSFGDNGLVMPTVDRAYAYGTDLAVTNDGGVVVLGHGLNAATSSTDLVLAKLAPANTLEVTRKLDPTIQWEDVDQIYVEQGQVLSQAISVTYQDGLPENLEVQLVGTPPAGLVLERTSEDEITLQWDSPNDIESNYLTLEAFDQNDPLVSKRLNLLLSVVAPHSAPVVEPSGPWEIAADEYLGFFVSASDDGPDYELQFELADDAPEGSYINSVTGEFGWTPGGQLSGQQVTFGIVVHDQAPIPKSTRIDVSVNVGMPAHLVSVVLDGHPSIFEDTSATLSELGARLETLTTDEEPVRLAVVAERGVLIPNESSGVTLELGSLGVGTAALIVTGTAGDVENWLSVTRFEPKQDFFSNAQVRFDIQSLDAEGSSVRSQTMPITVVGQVDAVILVDQVFPVFFDSENGASLGTIDHKNLEPNQYPTWSITGGTAVDFVNVHPETGELSIHDVTGFREAIGDLFVDVAAQLATGVVSSARITLIAEPETNVAPTAYDDTFDVDADSMVEGNLIGESSGPAFPGSTPDFDSDGDPIEIQSISLNGVEIPLGEPTELSNGATLTVGTGGNFVFDGSTSSALQELFEGTTTLNFSYILKDQWGRTDTAEATVNVRSVNELHTVANQDFTVSPSAEDGDFVGKVLVADTNVGESYTFELSYSGGLVFPGGGVTEFAIDDVGNLTVADDSALPNGPFELVVQVRGSNGSLVAADIFIGVEDNFAPEVELAEMQTREDLPLSSNIIRDYQDTEGDDITVVAVGGLPGKVGHWASTTLGGRARILPDGSIEYDPTDSDVLNRLRVGDVSSDSILLTLRDGGGNDVDVTVRIDVYGRNDLPQAFDNHYEVVGGNVVTGNLITDSHLQQSDFDPDRSTIWVTSVRQIEQVVGANELSVGDLGEGVAYAASESPIWLLHSEQDVQSRFGIPVKSATQFVAVRFAGAWEYSDGANWSPFTIESSDRLVATLESQDSRATWLEDSSPTIEGVPTGIQTTNLELVPDRRAGFAATGFVEIVGLQSRAGNPSDTLPIGDGNSGMVGLDNATGIAYVMYSLQTVQSRFGVGSTVADHLILTRRVSSGQWQYGTNTSWVNFTPVASDVMVATLDLGTDQVHSLQGTTGFIGGVRAGYIASDIVITPNLWNGLPNAGEFGVSGTYLMLGNETPFLSSSDSSSSEVQAEFTSHHGALVSVMRDGTFTFDTSAMDFTTALPGDVIYDWFEYSIVEAGTGNIASARAQFEIFTSADSVDLNVDLTGVSIDGDFGYVLYSQLAIHSDPRFDNIPANNSDHLITVRYENSLKIWQYNNGQDDVWQEFTPSETDHLVAQIDFSNDEVQTLTTASWVFGIAAGVATTDLEFTPNRFNNSDDPGEFSVTGTGFTKFSAVSDVTIDVPMNLAPSVYFDPSYEGVGFVLYSESDVFDRFASAPPTPGASQHFLGVRFNETLRSWEYADGSAEGWFAFDPASSDFLIATVDLQVNEPVVEPLENQFGELFGLSAGFLETDLEFQLDVGNNIVNIMAPFAPMGDSGIVTLATVVPGQSVLVGALNAGIASDDVAVSGGSPDDVLTANGTVRLGGNVVTPFAVNPLYRIDLVWDPPVDLGSDHWTIDESIEVTGAALQSQQIVFDLAAEYPDNLGDRSLGYRIVALNENGVPVKYLYYDASSRSYETRPAISDWTSFVFELTQDETEGDLRLNDVRLFYDSGAIDDETGDFVDDSISDDPRIYGQVFGDFTNKNARVEFSYFRDGQMREGSVTLDAYGSFVFDPRIDDPGLSDAETEMWVSIRLIEIDLNNASDETEVDSEDLHFTFRPLPRAQINFSGPHGVVNSQSGYIGASWNVQGQVWKNVGVTETSQIFVEFDYADIMGEYDQVPDGQVEAFRSTEPGTNTTWFDFDFEAVGLTGLSPSVRARAKEWSSDFNAYLYTEWTSPIQMPELTGVSIASLTEEHEFEQERFFPKVVGYLQGAVIDESDTNQQDVGNVSNVNLEFFHGEVEVTADTTPDGTGVTDELGWINYVPSGLEYGSNQIQARTVVTLSDGTRVLGPLNSLTVYVTEPNLPTLAESDFQLKYEEDATQNDDGSWLTSSATVVGTILENPANGLRSTSVFLQFAIDREDTNGDEETIVGIALPDGFGNFEYQPIDQTGDFQLKARVAYSDPVTGLEFAAADSWVSIDLEVVTPVNELAIVEGLSLANVSSDLGNTTTTPSVQGQVVNPDGYVAYLTVEVEDTITGEVVETTTDADGNFIATFTQMSPGSQKVQARATDWDYQTETLVFGQWSDSLGFELLEPAEASVSSLTLRSDTGTSQTDGVTANPLLFGTVQGVADLEGILVAIDRGGQVETYVETDANGRFWYQPDTLVYGPHTFQARVANWDQGNGDYAYGAGTTVDMTYELQPNSAAQVVEYGLLNPPVDGVVEELAIGGRIINELSLDGVTIEIDTNSDGTADFSVLTDELGNFYAEPIISSGTADIQLRTKELDAAGTQFLYGDWVSIATFEYQPGSNPAPVVSDLVYEIIEGVGAITGDVSDDQLEFVNQVELAWEKNGATFGIATVENGGFRYQLDDLDSDTDYTIWVRARESGDSGFVYSAPVSLSFNSGVSTSVVSISELGLANDTSANGGTGADGVTSDVTISGKLESDEDAEDFTIELDKDGDGSIDATISPDELGNFEFEGFSYDTPGYQTTLVRAVHVDGEWDSRWRRLNYIYDTDDGNQPALALASALTIIDANWQHADIGFDQDTAREISEALYEAALNNADADFEFDAAVAEQQRRATEAAAKAEYQQQTAIAQANYQASLSLAQVQFLAALNNLPAAQRINFELDDFVWPDVPQENGFDPSLVDEATPPKSPTYTGHDFDPERSPIYQRALALATQTFTNEVQAAKNAYREAADEIKETYENDKKAAQDKYDQAREAANERYEQLREEGRPDDIKDELDALVEQIREAQRDYRDEVTKNNAAFIETNRKLQKTRDDDIARTMQDEAEAKEYEHDEDCDHPPEGSKIPGSGRYREECGGDGGGSDGGDLGEPDPIGIGNLSTGGSGSSHNWWEWRRSDGRTDVTRVFMSPEEYEAQLLHVWGVDKEFAPKYEKILNTYSEASEKAQAKRDTANAKALKAMQFTIYAALESMDHLRRQYSNDVFEDNARDALEFAKDMANASFTLSKDLANAEAKYKKALADAAKIREDRIATATRVKDDTVANARYDAVAAWDDAVVTPWSEYQRVLASHQRDYDLANHGLELTQSIAGNEADRVKEHDLADAVAGKAIAIAAAEKTRKVALIELTTEYRIDVDDQYTVRDKELATHWRTQREELSTAREKSALSKIELDTRLDIALAKTNNHWTTVSGPAGNHYWQGWGYVVRTPWWYGELKISKDPTEEVDAIYRQHLLKRAEITRDRAVGHEDINETYDTDRINATSKYRKAANATFRETKDEVADLKKTYDIDVAKEQDKFNIAIATAKAGYTIAVAKAEQKQIFTIAHASADYNTDEAPLSENLTVDEATAYRD